MAGVYKGQGVGSFRAYLDKRARETPDGLVSSMRNHVTLGPNYFSRLEPPIVAKYERLDGRPHITVAVLETE